MIEWPVEDVARKDIVEAGVARGEDVDVEEDGARDPVKGHGRGVTVEDGLTRAAGDLGLPCAEVHMAVIAGVSACGSSGFTLKRGGDNDALA